MHIEKGVIYITLNYEKLDDITHDLLELCEKAEKRCNYLKKEHEGERSINFQLLEDYFYDLSRFLKEKNKNIITNMNNITELDLRTDNIFNNILTRR